MFGSGFEKEKNQLGDFLELEEEERKFFLHYENGKVEITPFFQDVFRIRITETEFEKDHSYAMEKSLEDFDPVDPVIEDKENEVVIKTSEMRLQITKNPFNLEFFGPDSGEPFLEDQEGYSYCRDEDSIRTFKKIRPEDHFYGFGEKTGPLDKRGESMEMFAGDRAFKKDEDPLYVSIPFFIGVDEEEAYGVFFDNTFRSHFDMGQSSEDVYSFGAENGEMNFYVFYGPEISEVVERYTDLTGTMNLPPKWAIGYHQCRWSYKTQERVLEVGETFREKGIPLDAIHLDIDYMDGFRVFTFDEDDFPDPEGMVDQLKDQGITTVAINDPGIKEDEDFDIYQDCIENEYYCENPEGGPARSVMWPGICIFPDFTRPEVREWWGDLHQFYFDLGIEGIWNDMNEPSLVLLDQFDFLPFDEVIAKTFRLDDQGRNSDLMRLRNVYGINEDKATIQGFEKHMPDKRPFLLTRSGYAGIQKYAAVWTGDNWSAFHQIGLSARMIMNLGLSGVSFAGADIGGFSGFKKYFRRDPDLYRRWIQTGVFYPFSRTHTAKGTKSQEPWSFGEEVESVSKRYIKLRYRFLPYLYSQFWRSSQSGEPIMKPLFYNYQDDENCYDERFEDQFLFGDDILVVPISERDVEELECYLPGDDEWTHYWTGEKYEGGKVHSLNPSEKDLPIFVRSGAVLPTQEPVQSTKEEVDKLKIHVYPGDGSFTLYEDDGETKGYKQGDLAKIIFKQTFSESSLELDVDKEINEYELSYEKYVFYIHLDQDIKNILVDGQDQEWECEEGFIKLSLNGIDIDRVKLDI